MIEDLKPYPQYKDSGLAWLGKVPAHWGIARSKRLFRQRKEFAQSDDQQLSATQAFGVIPQALYEQRTGYRVVKISMHLNKRKHVQADDFVISMRSFQGGLERAWAAGAIRSSYVVLEPGAEVSAGYFQHLFKSHQYINALRATSDFIRDGQDLNFGNFCGVDLPLIPLQEQAAIARFLAWATNRLDRAIGAKRRIIALLQEQKQAIIQRAVTRGLDPAVPLKDSGIPWLGEIPEHWEVLALKRVLSSLVDCEHKTAPFVQQSDYRVVRTSAVRNGLLRWDGTYCTSAKAFTEWTQRAVPEAGDVIFTREAPAGEACIIPEGAKVCLGQRTVLMKPQRAIYANQFLVHMIYAGPPRHLIELTCQGSTVSHFNMDDIGWMKVLAPPLSEQIEIVAKVAELTEAPSLAIDKTEREITLLREYRTRLIADVVTGKLDVREMAAGLPEEELQDQPDVASGYDADEAEEDAESDLIDTAED
jgi:type I restriction enzyme S subunit